jgi:hypothetical protein
VETGFPAELALAGVAFQRRTMRSAPISANPIMLGPQAPHPHVSSIHPIPDPTAAPPIYCMPSNIHVAVAAAFLPPKSIEAVPESIEWTMLIASELTTKAAMIQLRPGPIHTTARQSVCKT